MDGSSTSRKPWPDRWLLDAFRRLGHPAAQSLGDEGAESAWEALLAAGVPGEAVLETACALSACRPADLTQVGPAEAELFDRTLAHRYGVVPVAKAAGRLTIACANPLHPSLERDLEFASGQRIVMQVAPPDRIREALDRVYPPAEPELRLTTGELEAAARASARLSWVLPSKTVDAIHDGRKTGAVEILDLILLEALEAGASDIHFEPKSRGLIVRFRVDGVLSEHTVVPSVVAGTLTSRLKVMAGLDIADRLKPQDGRASMRFEGRPVDLRVSTLPLGSAGEKAVVRVLDAVRSMTTIEALGFLPSERARLDRLLQQTEGMVLVTGPTGSGKTTTLYSALRAVQSPGTNIVTVEDPIEYHLDGINQVQVHERSGLTFATALRSILRQDPDVVLVGEIRDLETADIAVKASMTGHLVLSTLHTNDAPSAVARLLDIGVEAGALAGALKGVIAQRLVRRLCESCAADATLDELPAEHRAAFRKRPGLRLRKAVGCDACRQTGYKGRMVVAEVVEVGAELAAAIGEEAPVGVITALARKGGTLSLWESGLERVAAGHTTLAELLESVAPPLVAEDGAAGRGRGGESARAGSSRSGGRRGKAKPATDGSAGRVLVVDEDRDARRSTRLALEAEGWTVVEAADGEAGLAYARRLAPALVLTEVALPRLDGAGLLQGLAGGPSAPPVVVWTRQTDPGLHTWLRELGAAEVAVQDPAGRGLPALVRRLARSGAA